MHQILSYRFKNYKRIDHWSCGTLYDCIGSKHLSNRSYHFSCLKLLHILSYATSIKPHQSCCCSFCIFFCFNVKDEDEQCLFLSVKLSHFSIIINYSYPKGHSMVEAMAAVVVEDGLGWVEILFWLPFLFRKNVKPLN